METLAQVMSPKHRTPGVDTSTAFSKAVPLSQSVAEHLTRKHYDIYQHVQDPAEYTGGTNLCPPGVPGADSDGLEDTQKTGDTNGHTPGHSVNIENNFAPKTIEKMFQPKSYHCLWDSSGDNDQSVGYSQVLEDHDSGLSVTVMTLPAHVGGRQPDPKIWAPELLYKSGKGWSISSTCLLSVFQAITISPRNSRCTELKVKAPKHIGSFIFLCWILHMVVNIIFPMYVTGIWNKTNITMKEDLGYCSEVDFHRRKLVVSQALPRMTEVLIPVLKGKIGALLIQKLKESQRSFWTSVFPFLQITWSLHEGLVEVPEGFHRSQASWAIPPSEYDDQNNSLGVKNDMVAEGCSVILRHRKCVNTTAKEKSEDSRGDKGEAQTKGAFFIKSPTWGSPHFAIPEKIKDERGTVYVECEGQGEANTEKPALAWPQGRPNNSGLLDGTINIKMPKDPQHHIFTHNDPIPYASTSGRPGKGFNRKRTRTPTRQRRGQGSRRLTATPGLTADMRRGSRDFNVRSDPETPRVGLWTETLRCKPETTKSTNPTVTFATAASGSARHCACALPQGVAGRDLSGALPAVGGA
ncbi:hypothetical protein HPG69_013959 [Diceros bicornis minor]|uniref:Uncharacterized protein n=1 Tax=Diceros bicornis minor TaxID=77932 RepID=A0A7J7EML5_DICBM|nr:hypothetical protein HPG69_013959 [Diceros bicornis minor]